MKDVDVRTIQAVVLVDLILSAVAVVAIMTGALSGKNDEYLGWMLIVWPAPFLASLIIVIPPVIFLILSVYFKNIWIKSIFLTLSLTLELFCFIIPSHSNGFFNRMGIAHNVVSVCCIFLVWAASIGGMIKQSLDADPSFRPPS